jgi:AraC-like DNA-binding protein
MTSHSGSPNPDPADLDTPKVWRRGHSFPVTLLRARYVNHSFPPHFHETFVLAVNEKGAHTLSRGGRKGTVSASEIGIVNPGETHAVERAGHDAWVHREDPLEQDALIVDGLSLLVMRHAIAIGGPRTPLRGGGAIKRARDYLEAHHAEPVRLDDLARIARLSRFHLLRQFNRDVGLPPHAYLLQLRIGRAKDLLSRGVPAGQVAHDVGFADQSHMHRYFKRFVGVTPGCYASGMTLPRKARSFKTAR